MLCYHFCSKIFLTDLKNKKIIYPNRNYIKENNRTNAYNYLYEKIGVDSLFFAWGSKDNKNSEIEYSNDSDFLLLTLEVPDNEFIITDYYNWCDVIFCLDEKNTLEDAEIIAQEEMRCSFEIVYNSIFSINENRNIQILLKSISYDWIRNIEYVKDKII